MKNGQKVPDTTKTEVYDKTIKDKFLVDDGLVKDYMLKILGRNWRDNRLKLYNKFYNESLTRDQNIQNNPPGVPQNEWASYIDYWLRPETKLSVPHTGGSKTLARRKDEMEIECGHRLGRGIMYKATHTKKDGTPINDEAKEIIDKIDASESEKNSSQIGSSTDSLTRVLGKEHPGYVRGMGLGPCPSQVLGSTTHQMRGVSLSSTNEVALVEEVKDLREELRTSNERMHTLEAQMTQMASVLRSVAGHILADLSNIIGSQFSD